MAKKKQKMKKNTRKEGFIAILLVVIGCVIALGLATLLVSAIVGQLTGLNSGVGNDATADGQKTECSGGASVPTKYMPWVKTAAARWMGGDEAGLISIIQIESQWNPAARNSEGTATGLGQFVDGTAEFMPEFYGGCDVGKFSQSNCTAKGGRFWPSAGITKKVNNPTDPRHDPERSIFAVARYFADRGAGYSGFLNQYKFGYHTLGKTANSAAEAQKATDNLKVIYDQVKKGCTVLNNDAFEAGLGCNNVPLYPQCRVNYGSYPITGGTSVCNAGCMLMSTAMVLKHHGANVTPQAIASYSLRPQMHSGNSVSSNFWTHVAQDFGVPDLKYMRTNWNTGLRYLTQGSPIILYGRGTGAPFNTRNEHFMVATCFDSQSRIVRINDPMRKTQTVPEALLKAHLIDVRVYHK